MASMVVGLGRVREIWRYYQAGALNAGFGFGVFALLVALGINLFVAQIIAHVLGIAFNYVSYSRHVFRGAEPAKLRFVLSYLVNYLVSLAMLFLASQVVRSAYLAGLLSILSTSIINYFALKYLVFVRVQAS